MLLANVNFYRWQQIFKFITQGGNSSGCAVVSTQRFPWSDRDIVQLLFKPALLIVVPFRKRILKIHLNFFL